MDPITAIMAIAAGFASTSGAVAAIGNMISGDGDEDFKDLYPQTSTGDLPEESSFNPRYVGRNVEWIGTPGHMFPADPDYMTHIDGKIFSPGKIEAVAREVRRAASGERERLVFYSPYGQIQKIDIDYIKDSMEYEDENQGVALTTGDEELDEFIREPIEVMSMWDVGEDEEGATYHEELDIWMDQDGWDELQDIKKRIIEAEQFGEGDLGKWTVSVRDGNHRAFGSALGGESVIWIKVMDNDVQDAQQAAMYPEKYTGKYYDGLREMLKMLR